MPERGWAIDREEGNIGVSCVAAPIFGPLGDVAAALSVTGPSQLVRADRIGPAVRMAAAAASRAYTSRPRPSCPTDRDYIVAALVARGRTLWHYTVRITRCAT